MGHFDRLQLVARVTYYFGWISLLLGGLVHLNIGKALFATLKLSQRNLFEVSVVLFLICLASGIRALISAGREMPVVTRKPIAA